MTRSDFLRSESCASSVSIAVFRSSALRSLPSEDLIFRMQKQAQRKNPPGAVKIFAVQNTADRRYMPLGLVRQIFEVIVRIYAEPLVKKSYWRTAMMRATCVSVSARNCNVSTNDLAVW